MKKKMRRTVEEINHAPLCDFNEASRLTGYCVAFLYDKAKQNRLRTYNSPKKIVPAELVEAAKAGFPLLVEEGAA